MKCSHLKLTQRLLAESVTQASHGHWHGDRDSPGLAVTVTVPAAAASVTHETPQPAGARPGTGDSVRDGHRDRHGSETDSDSEPAAGGSSWTQAFPHWRLWHHDD